MLLTFPFDIPDTVTHHVRIGRFDYMNVAPVYYGIDEGLKPPFTRWVRGTPATLNDMMAKGQIDIGPISSAAYAWHWRDWLLFPDLSIACHGRVMSVLLASRFPLEQLSGKSILLTDESASASILLKIILQRRHISPHYRTGKVDAIPGADAQLIIGDKALNGNWEARYEYVWDLGWLWKEETGLPFVFGLWAVRKTFTKRFPDLVSYVAMLFNVSKSLGLANLETISTRMSETFPMDIAKCREYFSRLQYDLDDEKQAGMDLFFKALLQQRVITEPVRMEFFHGKAQNCEAMHSTAAVPHS